MPSVPATGGSGGSRPQRSEPSASGATPPCSSSIASAPGLLPTHAEGRKGHCLHRLERTRFLLQKRPGGGGLRRSLPSAAPGLQHGVEIGCGHFWREDLRSVRAQLLAAGHQPKVALRGLCEWSALRLRASGGDCVIRESSVRMRRCCRSARSAWACPTEGSGWPGRV